jgi:preprotein translocase subunit SecY
MGGFQNIGKIPELKRRIIVSLLLLAVYRLGVHIPTPGIDGSVLAGIMQGMKGTLLGFFDMFAGGGLERLSIFALGIMPYISASIILQLLTVVVPTLEKLSKEGDAGKRKITQYTRYGTVVISIIQGFGIAMYLEQMKGAAGEAVVYNPGLVFRLMTMITLTAGTAFIMWLGEQITEKGIGNGISLIIFAGIVARLPNAIAGTATLVEAGTLNWFLIILLFALVVAVIGFIVFMETSQRSTPRELSPLFSRHRLLCSLRQ